jgi:hypothetical protein
MAVDEVDEMPMEDTPPLREGVGGRGRSGNLLYRNNNSLQVSKHR